MQERIYLLSIEEFLEESQGEALMEEALSKVDKKRGEKAKRIRQQKGKAACLGAGLLLQMAVRNYIGLDEVGQKSDSDKGKPMRVLESSNVRNKLVKYTVRELLAQIKTRIPLEFTYGSSGKPYLKEYPFCFNLSHSGGYVICAVSDREIGVDIQEHRGGNMDRIAKRYFSAGEIQALDECVSGEREKRFFDMWAAKEAYGKYTGCGITESLEREIPAQQVTLQLIHSIPGYSFAVCKGIE